MYSFNPYDISAASSGGYTLSMVLILEGRSEHFAYFWRKKLASLKVNLRFETSVNLNKCLEQIKLPITPHTCATIHRLLSSKNTIIPRFCPREHKRTQPISVSWPLILNTYEDVTPNRGKKTHLIIKCVSMIIALRRNNEEKENVRIRIPKMRTMRIHFCVYYIIVICLR